MTNALGSAWLFCPADRPERFAKAAAVADVVILDLEDGVAPGDKQAARDAVAASDLDPERTVIRVNAPATQDHDRDAEMIERTRFRRIMLPKCESQEHITAWMQYEVVVLIETPLGAVRVNDLATAANAVGLMWGAEDLVAGLGGNTSRGANGKYHDVARHVRSSTLLAAKAFSRFVLDAVHLDIADLDGLRQEAEDAVAVGFDATVAIHPTQVPIIRAAYRPSKEEIDWAHAILAEVPHHRGVFTYAGKMVDSPVLRHAEALLRRVGEQLP